MASKTGQRIRELRAEKGITQSELAVMLDKTCSAPRMWELGKSMPDAATIIKLAAYFGCSSDYLLDISDFKTENEKTDYITTEQTFYERLGHLRGRDKMRLMTCLNHFIEVYLSVEDETQPGFESLAALIGSMAEMFEEIKTAAERRANKLNDPAEAEKDKMCEQNAHGISTLGGCKLAAYEALECMHKQLLNTYLQIIGGVLCCQDGEPDTE